MRGRMEGVRGVVVTRITLHGGKPVAAFQFGDEVGIRISTHSDARQRGRQEVFSLPLQKSKTLETPYSAVDPQLSHGASKVETIAGGATIERGAAFAEEGADFIHTAR